jgi:hypothetical protein
MSLYNVFLKVNDKGSAEELSWFKDFFRNSLAKCPKPLADLVHGTDNIEYLNANMIIYNNLSGTKRNWEFELKVYIMLMITFICILFSSKNNLSNMQIIIFPLTDLS